MSKTSQTFQEQQDLARYRNNVLSWLKLHGDATQKEIVAALANVMTYHQTRSGVLSLRHAKLIHVVDYDISDTVSKNEVAVYRAGRGEDVKVPARSTLEKSVAKKRAREAARLERTAKALENVAEPNNPFTQMVAVLK